MKTLRLICVFAMALLVAFPSIAAAQTAQQAEAVPNVTGMKATEAQRMLVQQGWKAGMEYRTVSDPKQDGTILGTKPPAGTRVSKQQALILVAGKLSEQVRVPNVTGMPLAEAQKALVANKLNAQVIRENTGDPGKNQIVLKQQIAPGTAASPGSTVPIVVGVHTAPAQVKVPYIMGKPLAEAQKILVENKLNAQVTHQPVAEPQRNGVVIGQKVAVGTPLAPGSMVPVIVGQYTPPLTTAVPNVTGVKSDAARQNLEKQGWKVNVQEKPVTDAQQSGVVVQQIPPPGTQVQQKNQPVTLYVGKAQERVPVPQVAGMKLQEAQAVLSKARLNAQVSTQPVAEPQRNGVVLGMKVAAGTPVAPGTMVPLVVGAYTAPATKPVPGVKGMPGGSAMQRLQSQGWKVDVQRKTVTDARQNNVVLQQSPEAGAQVVPAQQAVTLFVGQYHETVRVPSIVGMTFKQAETALKQAKLKMNAGARTVQDRTKIGTVLDQNPAPGAAVEPGSQVVVTMGLDPKTRVAGPQNNPYHPYNPPITPDSTSNTK
jgi:beta-lactam-binding protein with PASTA domain